MPEHRQMAANVIAEFNREMKGMNMAGDAAWTTTVDSLRQDLVRMPEMPADELAGFMPAHEGRLNRLMEMHRAMMASMKRQPRSSSGEPGQRSCVPAGFVCAPGGALTA